LRGVGSVGFVVVAVGIEGLPAGPIGWRLEREEDEGERVQMRVRGRVERERKRWRGE
jgi:hypothetical protein